ncbi:efflux transporter outer membrane subunit [Luteibacter sp. SG786]|uniref:efflux transporter outer membrane subunit n=1 Tax=Luteibacter sp. SG786 TaxID=2587130 RepID=UPI00141FE55C|nr:efflux transporter outer membrane subunit [Luteibacter sp. SG786]NII53979.1 NodT family efflux transporter outer membrane factor (OMF) lipoprotein [Luteibacter sp. SG786]
MRTPVVIPLSVLAAVALAGCVVGPDFKAPRTDAPANWTAARAGDASLHEPVPSAGDAKPSNEWWKALGDPTLDELETRAASASPDLRTAALRFAQSRERRRAASASWGPRVDLNASGQRQRPSENGATSRTINVLAPAESRKSLVELLSQPFDTYEAGFDTSWEPDFWGRVRRSVEAADAGVDEAGALFDGARLDIAAEVAARYVELRGVQRRITLARQDIGAATERFNLMKARADGGMASDLDTTRQRALLADLQARLPPLLEREADTLDALSLLLGQPPGSLQAMLAARGDGDTTWALPDLALGLPSEVARRRPDIRQAEARLHATTANVGVAVADFYPRITLGAGFAFESLHTGDFGDWGSRQWSIGPRLDLPVFDMGRRRSVLSLRKLEQQEAAVAYQQTVLRAWTDIDSALNAYAAERQRNERLAERERLAADADTLADARYKHGESNYIEALDARRSLLGARSDKADSDAQLATRYVAVCKAIGGGDPH